MLIYNSIYAFLHLAKTKLSSKSYFDIFLRQKHFLQRFGVNERKLSAVYVLELCKHRLIGSFYSRDHYLEDPESTAFVSRGGL
jgi:hypothetical protein